MTEAAWGGGSAEVTMRTAMKLEVVLAGQTTLSSRLPSANRAYLFDAALGVYSNTALTAAATDGGAVAGWKDQSANAYHVTQATGSAQPIWHRSGLAGYPALEFTGANSQYLFRVNGASVLGNQSPYTVYIIFKTTGAGTQTYVSEGSSVDNTPVIAVNNSTASAMFVHRSASANVYATAGNSANDGNLHLITLRRISAGSFSLRLDGQEVGTGTGDPATTATNRLALGAYLRVTASQYLTGYIALVAAYNVDNYASVEPILCARFGIQSFQRLYFTIGGQAAEYLVPTPTRSGVLLIYHHGSGENQTSFADDGLKTTLKNAVLGAGHLVASSNAHGDNWGNSDSLADYIALALDAMSRWSFSKVVLISQSIGGLSGLTMLADGTITVNGWLGIYPACSLAAMWLVNAGYNQPAIKTAYGIAADGSDYAVKTAGFDPLLDSAALFATRLRFYASPADTIVYKADNSDAMAAHVAGTALENTVVVCSGNHGDPSHFQPADVLAFIARC